MNRVKQAIFVLPVKPYTQVNNYECGVACVQSVLAYVGQKVGRLALKKEMGTNREDGTDQGKIKKALRSRGVTCNEFHDSSLATLEKHVSKGKLCLVAYQAWGAKKYFDTLQSGHYSVVFGFEKEYLWLMDPNVRQGRVRYRKGIRKIKKASFLNRWKDVDSKGRVYRNWYLAINK